MHIIHIDGDSFFASCELLRRPDLKGKPVVTGGERGIATSMSKEAKALGVTRGMPSFMIRKQFPQVTIIASDYDLYRMMARRMYAIVRRFSENVEEYSVDECFAEIDDRSLAYRIKSALETELGVTYGVGVAQTKTLAKVASRYGKPGGIRFLCMSEAEQNEVIQSGISKDVCILHKDALTNMHVGGIWGIGRQTSMLLSGQGLLTAYDFTTLDSWYVQSAFHKNLREKWLELQGTVVDPVGGSSSFFMTGYSQVHDQKSICSSCTFEGVSSDVVFLLRQLAQHVEDVCLRARQIGMVARTCSFFLKRQDFSYGGDAIKLASGSANPNVFMKEIRKQLLSLIQKSPKGMKFRATGCTLYDLAPATVVQKDLFSDRLIEDKHSQVWAIADAINQRYGALARTPAIRPGLTQGEKRTRTINKSDIRLPRFSFPHLGFVK